MMPTRRMLSPLFVPLCSMLFLGPASDGSGQGPGPRRPRADGVDVGLQRHAARVEDRLARRADQRVDVFGRGAPGVDDEVRVLLADLRPALLAALQPGLLDQPARVVAGRVLEDRAAGGL